MYRSIRISLIMAVLVLFAGCGHKVPPGNPDYAKAGIRLIAVLPVKNNTTDAKAAQILRQRVFDELYFKGYPKMPLKSIDEKLSQILKDSPGSQRGDIPPQIVRELLGADAVMYCTLKEINTSYGLFYAPTRISVAFEIRNAKTGETLWRAQLQNVERCFGYSRNDVALKAVEIYEAAIQGVVDKALQTLSDGPELSS